MMRRLLLSIIIVQAMLCAALRCESVMTERDFDAPSSKTTTAAAQQNPKEILSVWIWKNLEAMINSAVLTGSLTTPSKPKQEGCSGFSKQIPKQVSNITRKHLSNTDPNKALSM